MSSKINTSNSQNTFRYSNETFSGCDMTATITINKQSYNKTTKKYQIQPYTKVIGELATISYSINMDKKPVRSIGNVNAKDYVMGQRTIAGSLVFSVFNKHFAEDIIREINESYPAGTSFLVDELPPFDLTISAANEYGYRSRLAIYGIRLLNEGQVMSINDVYTENTYQFFAIDLEYLTAEKKYIRDKSNKMYILSDNLSTHKNISHTINTSHKDWLKKQSKNFGTVLDLPIKLLYDLKQPTSSNSNGIVHFSLEPIQDEGIIYILKNNKVFRKIPIQNKRSASINLPPNVYTAYFQNIGNRHKSNTVIFDIQAFVKHSLLENYKPLIEYVDDSSIKVFSNEPSHNLVRVTGNGLDSDFPLNNRFCTINNLYPDSVYSIYTYNDKEKLPSKPVSVKTLSSKYLLFKNLQRYCMSNSNKLVNPIDIYNKLIDEAKSIAEKKNYNITKSLNNLKINYYGQLKKAVYNSSKYHDLDLKIKSINELIVMATRLTNDFTKAVNDEVEVPIPTLSYNKAYEPIITFDSKIDSAEFFKEIDKVNQFLDFIKKDNFRTIDGKPNSFRYLGKPGFTHYVNAMINNHRAPKLEFYVLSALEKENLIKKDLKRKKISKKELDFIEYKLNYENVLTESDYDYKRNLLVNIKNIDDPLFMPPAIEIIDKNVIVRNEITELFPNKLDGEYFIAIASYDEVINDSDIYKVPFTSADKMVYITKQFNGLKNNTVYAIWLENKNGQISNASTFMFNGDDSYYQNNVKLYEIKFFTDKLDKILDSTIESQNIKEQIKAKIEQDPTADNYMMTNYIMPSLLDPEVTLTELLNFLSKYQYYIGLMEDSTIQITDVSYQNNKLSLTLDQDAFALIYTANIEDCFSTLKDLSSGNNIIELEKDYNIITVFDKYGNKSNSIYVDVENNVMEEI